MQLLRQIRNCRCLAHPTGDHAEVLGLLRKCNLYSVIVDWRYPNQDVHENPEIYDKIPVCHCSPWELSYRREAMHRSHEHCEVGNEFRQRIEKHFGEDREEVIKTFDAFLEGYSRRLYVDIFIAAEMQWACEFFSDEELEKMEDREILKQAKEKHPQEYKEWYLSFCLPELNWDYHIKPESVFRDFPLLAGLARSRGLSQFFFAENEHLNYAYGSTDGSGTRESLGYYGYAFLELQKEGKDIPSCVLVVSSNSGIARLERESGDLILYPPYFGCNYHLDRERADKLREGMEHCWYIKP